MSSDPERPQQAMQQPPPSRYAYEPPPLSLHDAETLPDHYPAFDDEKTLPDRLPRMGPIDSDDASDPFYGQGYGQFQQQVPMGAAHLYPPAYRARPFLPWLLIALGALGGILLLAGAGFVVLNAEGIHTWSVPARTGVSAPQHSNATSLPEQVAREYYNAIENQNYAAAYSYLQINTFSAPGGPGPSLDQTSYSQQAQIIDADFGHVTNYTIFQTEMLDTSNARVFIGIERGDGQYRVALDLHQSNGAWHIVQFNRI